MDTKVGLISAPCLPCRRGAAAQKWSPEVALPLAVPSAACSWKEASHPGRPDEQVWFTAALAAPVALVVNAPRTRRRFAVSRRQRSCLRAQTAAVSATAQLHRASDYCDEIKRIIEQAGPSWDHTGASTGWKAVDELYRPVPGELTVITGQPGHGKSEFLLSLVMNLAEKHGWRFVMACFEARRSTVILQLLQKRLRKNKHQLRDLVIADHDWDWMKEHFTFMSEPYQETPLHELLAAATIQADLAKASGQKLHGLVLDPYNFIERPAGASRFASDTQLASDQLTRIKQWARDYHCHVWLVVHPSKNTQWASQARPQLYDCSGSAHFNNKCDMGLVVARHKDEEGQATLFTDIFVEKVRNRDAGQIGNVKLSFNPSLRTFSDSTTAAEEEFGFYAEESAGSPLQDLVSY